MGSRTLSQARQIKVLGRPLRVEYGRTFTNWQLFAAAFELTVSRTNTRDVPPVVVTASCVVLAIVRVTAQEGAAAAMSPAVEEIIQAVQERRDHHGFNGSAVADVKMTHRPGQLTWQHDGVPVALSWQISFHGCSLREVEELSYEEIAQAIGVPKGTVMSRLFHARRKLLEVLKPMLDAEDIHVSG